MKIRELTKELIADFMRLLNTGCMTSEACKVFGISIGTFNQWMVMGEEVKRNPGGWDEHSLLCNDFNTEIGDFVLMLKKKELENAKTE